MKTLTKIRVGGSSNRQDLLKEYLLDKKLTFSSTKMEFGKLVHSWCLDHDSFKHKIKVVDDSKEISLYKINDEINLFAETVEINESLFNDLNYIRKNYLDSFETAKCITLDSSMEYSLYTEEECTSDKSFIRTVEVDETPYNINYEVRGRLDLCLVSNCGTKAVLMDIKTNSIDSLKKGAKLPSLLANYKSQMYHYSFLLHELYPNLQDLQVCLIVLRTKNNKLCGWDVQSYLDCNFSNENCSVVMEDRITSINNWFQSHLSKPYIQRMEIYKQLINDGDNYTLGGGAGAEEVTGSTVKALLNDNLQLMKLTSDDSVSSPLEYPEEYNRKVAEICSVYTSSTGSPIKIRSELEMAKMKPCFYIAVARGYSITSSKPDCYIFPLKGGFYVVYQSYHYVERKIREKGYNIDVLFTKNSDFPTNIHIDMIDNKTTIHTSSPENLARFNRDGCKDFDFVVCIVTHNREQLKTFVYSKGEVLKYMQEKGAWSTHLYEMCRKTCIRKVVSQCGELANLVQITDVCDSIWGKKEVIIDSPIN